MCTTCLLFVGPHCMNYHRIIFHAPVPFLPIILSFQQIAQPHHTRCFYWPGTNRNRNRLVPVMSTKRVRSEPFRRNATNSHKCVSDPVSQHSCQSFFRSSVTTILACAQRVPRLVLRFCRPHTPLDHPISYRKRAPAKAHPKHKTRGRSQRAGMPPTDVPSP